MTPEKARELLDIANRGAGDGQRPVTVAASHAPLVEAAPALAELIANMYYRYAAQVEMYPSPGPQPFLTENGDPTFNDSDIKWFATLEGARRHGGIYAPDDYRVARRLVSRSEVVE